MPPIASAAARSSGEIRLRRRRGGDHLLWRLDARRRATISPREARRLIAGEAGRRLGEAGVMVAMVDGAGTHPRRQRRLRRCAPPAPTARAGGRGQPLRRSSRRRAERPVPFRRRGQGRAAAAHHPGPGRRRPGRALRSSCCSTTFRARAARTRPPMSTPCSTACRSAWRWPTATAASSSSTRRSARRPASAPSERPA